MKIVYISKYFNHHHKALSDAFNALTENNFNFIETAPMSVQRQNLGWSINEYPDYVIPYRENNQEDYYSDIIDTADVVIIGSAPMRLIENRLKNGLLTFMYSERIYKENYQWYKWLYRLISFYLRYGRHKKLYMLCASAYTAADYAKTFTFLGKTYKWGYFPEARRYDDINELIKNKKPMSLLWVGRFIDWKHPELPVLIAEKLKNEGYLFELNLIGTGVLEQRLKEQIQSAGLSDCVHLLGVMNPDQVREYMERSQIYIFTSDRQEGWGAVLNEAMNSGCAVVASHAIGSVPFLLQNGQNGYIYRDSDIEDLYTKVRRLIDNNDEREKMGVNAYKTITEHWNAENAALRFIELSKYILNGNKKHSPFETGLCSDAGVISDNWFKESF
jgi:glycosyltransferase involved in cell wall biosynthesis